MSQTALPDISIPDDVDEFCTREAITTDLQTAIRLADEVFAPVRRWTFAVEVDPETGERAVTIDIDITMNVEQAIDRHGIFTKRWVERASAAGAYIIRLITNQI